ncbi:ABC transporter permease subunit [Verrucomicrobiales bacterium BCK34]|nr:ABC transporter permease subunit [Verrucomicrobiales bacterium BCK34]
MGGIFTAVLDPNTRRRLRRFGQIKRAKWALILLVAIFVISLFSNFIANDKPFLVKANGKLYFPVFKFYPQSEFTGGEVQTRPRYKDLEKLPLFQENKDNWMLWPLVRNGPEESLEPSQIEIDPTLTLTFSAEDQVATVDIDSESVIQRSRGAAGFYGQSSDLGIRRKPLESDGVSVPESIRGGIALRFANKAADSVSATNAEGILFELDAAKPRSRAPKLVRLSMTRKAGKEKDERAVMTPEMEFVTAKPALWERFSDENKARILETAKEAMVVPQEKLSVSDADGKFAVQFEKETVEFPFRPVKGHAFGLDNSGRDVGVRILYATRTALLFGIILVIFTYVIGIFLGSIQGYFGGKIDMVGQRLTEIWEAMPFLLIMILLSSIYGRSFVLLGIIYGIFNWIGISYYLRAEFLRLRKLPFVEAARVMGIGRWKIMFRHILPNALVPVITFFPFSLVGSIFMLTALDYLGFGLPPGTPSWGNLLDQGQVQQYAWWLILYPSLALFIVSLLGIFIGEGVRAAFDPRTNSKLE